MGKVGARAIEALVGGGLGGASLGAIGALTHKTKVPTEWLGDDDKVHARSLTKRERQERKKRVQELALIGMGLGAAGGLTSSGVRRALIKSEEAELLPKVIEERLSGLRKIVKERVRDADSSSFLTGTAERERRALLAEKAKNLLSDQEKQIANLAGAAASERSGSAWGGLRLRGSGNTPVPHESLTLEGQVERYYRDLQKKHNLPPMISPYDRGAVGEQFFRKLLEKQGSAQALLDELLSIEKNANVSTSILERIQSAARRLMGQAQPAPTKTVDEIMGITPRIQIDSEGVIYNKGKPVGLNATIASQRRHFPPGSRGAA